ncbi:MAG: hypothetical protein LBH41_01815 [Rickettsiales bacterium]|jgi:hypothetical protein|nr:hypothetical protein [Rickettsiales bacterium]
MKKILSVLALVASACARIEVKKDYSIVDAKDTVYPKWVKAEGRPSDNAFVYFVSAGEDVNKDLCRKSSEASAASTIAAEISQKITDSFVQTSKSDGDSAKAEKFGELRREIDRTLTGIQVADKFWEKRKFQTALGAEKDISVYRCWTLLKVSRAAYDRVLEEASKKLGESVDAGNPPAPVTDAPSSEERKVG